MTKAISIRIKVITAVALILVVVHIANIVLEGSLMQYGVIPRQPDKWFHIFTAPFIHGSISHLVNNLIGLGVFSVFCLVRSVRFYITASIFIIVMTGVLVMLFGRDASHIGASGWIFGLWGLSIATAWFDRSPLNIFIAVIVVFFYGGMIYGVLPVNSGVSFESHLFGVIAGGVFAAIAIRIPSLKRGHGRL